MPIQIELGYQADVTSLPDLLEEHWEEVAKNKQLMVLKPDIELYQDLEDRGVMFTLVAKENDKVIGYSINFIQYHLHYNDLLYCQNDVLFLKKQYRTASTAGIKLIKETEKEAIRRGAKQMVWHAKENTTLAEILPRMKYGVQDILFSRQLKET